SRSDDGISSEIRPPRRCESPPPIPRENGAPCAGAPAPATAFVLPARSISLSWSRHLMQLTTKFSQQPADLPTVPVEIKLLRPPSRGLSHALAKPFIFRQPEYPLRQRSRIVISGKISFLPIARHRAAVGRSHHRQATGHRF